MCDTSLEVFSSDLFEDGGLGGRLFEVTHRCITAIITLDTFTYTYVKNVKPEYNILAELRQVISRKLSLCKNFTILLFTYIPAAA